MPVMPLKKLRLEIESWHTKEAITYLCSVAQNTLLLGQNSTNKVANVTSVTYTFPETQPNKYTLKYFIFNLETKKVSSYS